MLEDKIDLSITLMMTCCYLMTKSDANLSVSTVSILSSSLASTLSYMMSVTTQTLNKYSASSDNPVDDDTEQIIELILSVSGLKSHHFTLC